MFSHAVMEFAAKFSAPHKIYWCSCARAHLISCKILSQLVWWDPCRMGYIV